MARRGRKRNPKAKRNQTTRAGQGRTHVDTGPEERAARRAELGIAHQHLAADFPLVVLANRGWITGEQCDAGLRYAVVHWKFLGAPFQTGTALAGWLSNAWGRLAREEADAQLHGLRIERTWRAYDAELRRAGHHARWAVRKAAVNVTLPDSVLQDLPLSHKPMYRRTWMFLQWLTPGLDALRNASLPEVGPHEEDEILDGLARLAG